MICFRITRLCNAHCRFCLAPFNKDKQPDATTLKDNITWLLSNGVKTIHFCGGEPTIHHDLLELINHVKLLNGKSKMTTNAIALSDELIATLHNCKTEVKVSLHGNEYHHNLILGCNAFNKTTENIRRLLRAKVNTSVQTTIISHHLDIVPWVIQFCIENRVKKVSFLPFIPRGKGNERRSEYGLSQQERNELRSLITQKRREYAYCMDIRLLDFTVRPIHVVEPDGSIILEGATEAMDNVLYHIDPNEIN
jgi:Predicted Fe-S oxidoreductases